MNSSVSQRDPVMQSYFLIYFCVGAEVPRLTDRTRSLTNLLWSRKRAVEDTDLRKKAVSLEKELWQRAMEKAGGGWHRKVLHMKKKKKNYFMAMRSLEAMVPEPGPSAARRLPVGCVKCMQGEQVWHGERCGNELNFQLVIRNELDVADVDEQLLEDRIRKKVLSELRRTTYHWTPLKYAMFLFL